MSRQLPLRLTLSNHTRLEDFVGVASAQITELDGFTLVQGDVGTGKSHLLEGLCHAARDLEQQSIYLPLEPGMVPDILQGLEVLQLICLDDVDEVVGKPEWDQALFHLINACRDQGVRLVMAHRQLLTSSTLPDLTSRLNAAYRVATRPLEDDEKLAVIKMKSARRGFSMSEEVCRFILSRAQRDMHHLATLVDHLDEETLRHQKRVTIPFVKEALGL